MKHEAIFRFKTPDAPTLYAALTPEVEESGRSRATIALENGEALVLHVEADDIPALRAALNTWLRLINIAKEMQEIVEYE
jgi:KEOPS complex subunit Pcc1